MQNLQNWFIKEYDLKEHPPRHCFSTPRVGVRSIHWWLDDANSFLVWLLGPQVTLTTDVSLEGWGAHCQGLLIQGKWPLIHMTPHISVLEPHIFQTLLGSRFYPPLPTTFFSFNAVDALVDWDLNLDSKNHSVCFLVDVKLIWGANLSKPSQTPAEVYSVGLTVR